MPQQIVLFDSTPHADNSHEMAAGEPDSEQRQPLHDAANSMDIDFTHTAASGSQQVNPLSEWQKKEAEKVDAMLLMPSKKRGRKSFKDMDTEAVMVEIPADDVLFQKQYYPTRVVAEWFGITASQLRAWENEFDILQPKKNKKGDRWFRPQDVKNLQLIYHLVRRRKFTVQGAKQYLAQHRDTLHTKVQLTESLTKLKRFLTELKAIAGS